jgi:hypothetical protein
MTPRNLPAISIDLVRAARRSDTYFVGADEAALIFARDRYLKFLVLVAEEADRPLAPTRDIDWMWHLHMLSPRAYVEDCRRIFGDILDHDGGFGSEESERLELMRVFEETSALWTARFGESYGGEPTAGIVKCTRNCVSRCWHACSKK